jgi:hypothetical protein
MSNIKKAYVELYQLMLDNPKKQIATMMPQFLEIMQAKSAGGTNGKTFKTDDEGNVTHIFCYYHKKWEPLAEVEFGKKKHSASGYNTMCKEGVSQWTKQQRVKKQAEQELLTKVANGELKPEDIADEQARILEESKRIEPRDDEIGFDELD